LLRARRERPRGRGAAKQRDERAAFQLLDFNLANVGSGSFSPD